MTIRALDLADIVCCARALRCVPLKARAEMLQRLIGKAEEAHAYRTKFGKLHAFFGNGSLAAVARTGQLAPSDFSDLDFRLCLKIVLDGVAGK